MPFNIKTKKILSEENCKRIIMLGISLKDQISNVESKCLEEYDESKTYIKDKYVTYNNYIYKAKTTTTGSFDESKWIKIGDDLSLVTIDDIKSMINLTDEEIVNLQSLILDSEIRLDKTFSSSKIYTDIQNAISEGKTFTLEQFAKKTGASYKLVTSIDEVNSEGSLYLILNETIYDIYAFIDGSPVKIGDTNIDLSSYAKLTDLDNYYDKATSDGKYATITTVDGKVDKTSILSTISDSPSDEKLLSEKAIKSELDNKANDSEVVKKSDITTTIGSNSTDEQIPSAKSVYNNIIENKLGNLNLDYTYQQSDSMNIKLTHFGAYKFNAPTKGVPSDNIGDWVLINIPWQMNSYGYSPTMQYANQLLFSPRKSDTFWFRRVWNYVESTYVYTEGDYSVFGKWRTINASGVDNLSTITVNTFENTALTGNVRYEIKNGVCYVAFNDLKCTSTSVVRLLKDMPKNYGCYKPAPLLNSNNEVCGKFSISTNDTNIYLITKDTTNNLTGYLSYPVADN